MSKSEVSLYSLLFGMIYFLTTVVLVNKTSEQFLNYVLSVTFCSVCNCLILHFRPYTILIVVFCVYFLSACK